MTLETKTVLESTVNLTIEETRMLTASLSDLFYQRDNFLEALNDPEGRVDMTPETLAQFKPVDKDFVEAVDLYKRLGEALTVYKAVCDANKKEPFAIQIENQ